MNSAYAKIDRQRVKADINSQGYATLPIPAPPRNSLHPEPLPSNDNPNVPNQNTYYLKVPTSGQPWRGKRTP